MPDHETIVVNEDDTHSIVLRDGDVVENKLIDITAEGAAWDIDAWGDGWELRNVGIKGKVDDEGGPGKGFRPGCPEGGTGLVEHCYFSGRDYDMGWSYSFGNVWIRAKHAGHIEFVETAVVDAADNGIYGTGPVKDKSPQRGQGTARIERCHAENNGNGNFRLGGVDAAIVDSTVLIEKKTPPTDHPNPHGARGIVAEGTDPLTVSNCDVSFRGTGGYGVAAVDSWTDTPIEVHGSRITGPIGSSVELIDSEHGPNAADPTPREGVPTSAREAAQGDLFARPGSDDTRYVTVHGVGSRDSPPIDYSLRVSNGRIWPGEDTTAEDRIHSSQTVAEGRVWAPWFDDYHITAEADLAVETDSERLLVLVDDDPLPVGVMAGQNGDDQSSAPPAPEPDPETVEKRARELLEQRRGELVDDISSFLSDLTSFVEEYDDWGDEET
jgi:hypothetical protein